MPIHTGRLVLTAADPHAVADPDLLTGVLAQAGFIGAPLRDYSGAYSVGPQFLSLVTFAGCAVALPSAPGILSDGAFAHVLIPKLAPAPRLLTGRNTRAPRCPSCRARLKDWRSRTAYWREHPMAGLTCPACGETRPPWRWDWKEQGGFGRVFILVEEVFPGEAVPTPSLLDLLTHASGSGWRHFYVQD